MNKGFKILIAVFVLYIGTGCRPQTATTSSTTATENASLWTFRGTISIIENENYLDIFTEARRKTRPIFISFYTDWCPTCPWLNENVVKSQQVRSFLEESFVSFIMDAEYADGVKLAEEYNISAFPTLLYLDSEGKEITRYIGYPDKHKIIQFGRVALAAEEKLQKEKKNKKK